MLQSFDPENAVQCLGFSQDRHRFFRYIRIPRLLHVARRDDDRVEL